MLHTVTEMFWMKRDAWATTMEVSRSELSARCPSKNLWFTYMSGPHDRLENWRMRVPLFLGLRSTQSPIMAPRSSTEPATTKPNTAVSSRFRPYSSIRKTEIAKCHIRSPYRNDKHSSELVITYWLFVQSTHCKMYVSHKHQHLLRHFSMCTHPEGLGSRYDFHCMFIRHIRLLTHMDRAPLT